MTKNEIYKKIYVEIDEFMKELSSNLRERLGTIHFYFDFNSLCYSPSGLVAAHYEIGDNSITFFLENIKRLSKTSKEQLRLIIIHEIAHALGFSDNVLESL